MTPCSSYKKIFYLIRCLNCSNIVCRRALRSTLVFNTKIKLYSTNIPSRYVKCVGNSYMAYSCNCVITDTSCKCCHVILGYHILHPCSQCMQSRNNGHLWMFDINSISSNKKTMECPEAELSDSFTFCNDYDHEVKIR